MSRRSRPADGPERPPAAPLGTPLSDVLGRRVTGGGTPLGRVADIAALPGAGAWPVVAIRLRGARHEVVAAGSITAERGSVVVWPAEVGPPTDELVWLRERVLDHRVIDVDGRRVVRVGDVALERTTRGLEVVAIELGVAPVLHRLGLRRLAARRARVLLPLDVIHVPHSPRDAIELTASAARLAELAGHDLAEVLARLTVPEAGAVLAHLPADDAARALAALHPEHAVDLLASTEPPVQGSIVDELPAGHDVRRLHRRGRPPRRLTRRRFLRRHDHR